MNKYLMLECRRPRGCQGRGPRANRALDTGWLIEVLIDWLFIINVDLKFINLIHVVDLFEKLSMTLAGSD